MGGFVDQGAGAEGVVVAAGKYYGPLYLGGSYCDTLAVDKLVVMLPGAVVVVDKLVVVFVVVVLVVEGDK